MNLILRLFGLSKESADNMERVRRSTGNIADHFEDVERRFGIHPEQLANGSSEPAALTNGEGEEEAPKSGKVKSSKAK